MSSTSQISDVNKSESDSAGRIMAVLSDGKEHHVRAISEKTGIPVGEVHRQLGILKRTKKAINPGAVRGNWRIDRPVTPESRGPLDEDVIGLLQVAIKRRLDGNSKPGVDPRQLLNLISTIAHPALTREAELSSQNFSIVVDTAGLLLWWLELKTPKANRKFVLGPIDAVGPVKQDPPGRVVTS